MSYADIVVATRKMNDRIGTLRSGGVKFPLEINGKPSLKIESLDPLVYTRYGLLRDRAPHVSGTLALRAVMTSETDNDTAVIYLAADTGVSMYGFSVDEVGVLNGIAKALGQPELAIFVSPE